MQKLLYTEIKIWEVKMEYLSQSFDTRQFMMNPDFEMFHYKDEPNLEVEYHNHDFYEIYFFISGKVSYMIEGKFYSLKPGDIILINNKELHRPVIESGEIYERIVIWVNLGFLEKHSSEDSKLSMCFDDSSKKRYNMLRPSGKMLKYIKSIISRLGEANVVAGYGSSVLKEVYLTELIVYLNKAYMETFQEDIEVDIAYNDKVSEIINYINDNINKTLSLEVLSAKYYISKYHLLREFKKYTGYTIYNYIYKKRLLNARDLLRKGCSVTEVCQTCGFGDYSNFIRAFRKTFGISPKKFGSL
jgi:AraC-like DNA-binding protein/mannose-6-phosphate isomerase-like protein (cupin superfamily)